ncbi:MAG: DsbA family protein [Anaerolineae bacterium]|nr:DsbA family protein [Anaerolineae bacterium]
MNSTRSKNRADRNTLHSPGQRMGLKQYSLLIGIVAVAVIIVSALVILGQRSSRTPQLNPADVSLDKSAGAKDAPVVVIEYADFQCPYCKQFATGPELQLRQAYVDTGKVRFVFRNLAFIGPESLWAAEAAECANEQGRFWDYHDKLFAEQAGENEGTFSRENLTHFAAELGLDTQQFNQCLDSNKYQAKVQQEIGQAEQLGVHSTPTLFVNGQLIRNGSDYQVLQTAITTALKAAESG